MHEGWERKRDRIFSVNNEKELQKVLNEMPEEKNDCDASKFYNKMGHFQKILTQYLYTDKMNHDKKQKR